jgi:lipopolysaccharide export system permease protein
MIFQRSILRELITVVAVILFTLLTITTVLFLVRVLKDAAVGNIALDGLLQVLLLTVLKYFALIVVIAVFLSIILTVSRLYRDSEMSVWQTSGLNSLSLLKPIAMMVLPIFLLVLFFSMALTPWSARQMASIKDNSGVQELSLIKSATFRTANRGQRVFYIGETPSKDSAVFKDVFVVQQDSKGSTIIVAKQAAIEKSFDARSFLVLKDGRQYDDKPQEQLFQSLVFRQYGVSLDEFTKVKTSDLDKTPVAQRSTMELYGDADSESQGELFRRVSDAFMLLPMALLALFFGHVKPRGVKTYGVLGCVLAFIIYLNVVKAFESYVGFGQISSDLAFALIHGGALLLAAIALTYRQYAWRLSGASWLRWRART